MTSHIINYDINTNLPNLKVQNNLPFVHIFSIHLNTIDPEGLKQELAYLKRRKGERKTKPCDVAELRQRASASGHRSESSSALQCTSCFISSKLLNLCPSAPSSVKHGREGSSTWAIARLQDTGPCGSRSTAWHSRCSEATDTAPLWPCFAPSQEPWAPDDFDLFPLLHPY